MNVREEAGVMKNPPISWEKKKMKKRMKAVGSFKLKLCVVKEIMRNSEEMQSESFKKVIGSYVQCCP